MNRKINLKKKIRTSSADIRLDEEGIFWVEYQIGHIEEIHVKENFKLITELGGGKPRPLVNLVDNVVGTSNAARKFGASEEVIKVVSALGLVSNSAVSNILGNVFIRVAQPPYPTRLFSTSEKALVWLREYLNND